MMYFCHHIKITIAGALGVMPERRGTRHGVVLVLVIVLLLMKRWRRSSISQDFLDGGPQLRCARRPALSSVGGSGRLCWNRL